MSANEEVVIWTRMAGVRQFLADATAEARAVRTLGLESEAAGKRGFVMNQALFTARRFLYAGTIALSAFTAAALHMGFSLNITMEESRIAFTKFLGSVDAADKELNYLYDFAAKTPFRFEEVIVATRRFLAFGFTLQETNKYMQIIADTAAGLGGNVSDTISRLVLVFGQMKASGRVLGNDLLQLAALGINARGSLQRAFNLTPKELANIGALQIPADLGIQVIMRDLSQQFEGMSAKQAQTFRGRWSTLMDYLQQTFGKATEGLYNRLRDRVFPALTDFAQQLTVAINQGGFMGVIEFLDRKMGAGGGLVTGVKVVTYWMTVLWHTLEQLAPAAKTFLFAMLPIITLIAAIISLVAADIELLNKLHLTGIIAHGVAIVLALLITRMILLKTVTIAMTIWQFRWNVLLVWNMRILTPLTRLLTFMVVTMRAYAFATAGATAAERARFGAAFLNNGLMARSLRTMFRYVAMLRVMLIPSLLGAASAAWAFTIALLANPITWIVLAVAALVAGLIILYFKWKWFHNFVNGTFDWIRTHWKLLAAILLAPFIALPLAVYGVFRLVKAYFWDVVNWIRGIVSSLISWIRAKFESLRGFFSGGLSGIIGGIAANAIPGYGLVRGGLSMIPGLATGGTVTQSGITLVGERGPEIMNLGRGARVTPLNSPGLVVELEPSAPVILKVDGRKLAESDARWRLRVKTGNA